MSKVLLLFLIFICFQLSLSLSSPSKDKCPLYSNLYYILQKCDVEKDAKQIYNGKYCSNVVQVHDRDSTLFDRKIYLEIVNVTVIKQWTLTNTSHKSVVIDFKKHKFCNFFTPDMFESRVDLIFVNPFGAAFYTSWNLYYPHNWPLSFSFLTNNSKSPDFLSTEKYIALINYDNDTVTEQLFSKEDREFVEFYLLQKFDKQILSLKYSLIDASTITATLEDGSEETFSVKYPSEKTYDGGITYRSTSSDGRYFIILPVGLIFYAIKACFCPKKRNMTSVESDDKNPLVDV